MTGTEAPDARISAVQCQICRQLVPADVVLPGIDAQCDAALAAALADCPYAPGRHRIRRGARTRTYRHPAIAIGAAA